MKIRVGVIMLSETMGRQNLEIKSGFFKKKKNLRRDKEIKKKTQRKILFYIRELLKRDYHIKRSP